MIASLILSAAVSGGAIAQGSQLYAVHCATCHGVTLQGSSQGPPLITVPARNVDFMLQTGRMPAAIPFEQEEHRVPSFPPAQIAALVAFVASKSSAEKTLPVVGAGDAKKGREVFAENCEQCHAATGHGDSVGYQDVAPELMDDTPREIAEAVRMGPDVMPKFGPKIIADQRLNDLVAYIQFLQHGQYNPGGLQLANFGPVPEGFIAWVIGLGLLVLLVRRIGTTE
ncbi:MAG TPA: c-type cytochrome [Candidatus Baltobacteraceae bacterium]|nr:c-type cytochrome [Candidatus Baltobacteraceae bacterium]